MNAAAFKAIFQVAAIYNVIWGAVVVMFPQLMFDLFGMERINHPFLMQGIGMFVAVYGYGYWVVSQDLYRYPQLVIVGLLGKTLGPIGWLFAVLEGQAPWASLWVNVFNDLIWIPFFTWYLIWHKKQDAPT